MGMFDTYVPAPAVRCPACDVELRDWQGKDGPCQLVVWLQGERRPRGTFAGELAGEVEGLDLPSEFLIYSYDCECFPDGVEVVGRCEDGVWTSTAYLTPDAARRLYYFLPKEALEDRIARLRKAGL